LLDGRRATTHWAHCQELARTYPDVEVDPDSLFVLSVWTESALPVSQGLREILDSVVADPAADHSIAAMAARAAVSERHLVRTTGIHQSV
jgi:transcriptional regulator GlxA family with amidase domain